MIYTIHQHLAVNAFLVIPPGLLFTNPHAILVATGKLDKSTNRTFSRLLQISSPKMLYRDDGTTFTGEVPFNATKPVEVDISHRLHIDNNTFSSLIQIDLENYILDSIM